MPFWSHVTTDQKEKRREKGRQTQMKLDRNINRGGRGKYALVNMRKLIPILDKAEAFDGARRRTTGDPTDEELAVATSFAMLVNRGIISLGNETPGDQFFVMKYKDKFTERGLAGYADAVWDECRNLIYDPLATARMEKQLHGEPLTEEEKAAMQVHNAALRSLREFHEQMRDESRAAHTLGNRIPD